MIKPRIINRTSIGIDVRGFEIDHQHVYIERSENYFVGKRFGGVLELSSFTPDELRNLHSVSQTFAAVDAATADLPPEVLEQPEVKHMLAATEKMRAHVASLPSLELLEQFEQETEDGWYLYPRKSELRV
jgi:hypothetical protein